MASLVVLVTGGSTGIGRATCLAFAKWGQAAKQRTTVVIADVNGKAASDTQRMVEDLGEKALYVPTDVSQEADVQRLAREIKDKCGELHYVVANAGIEGAAAPLHEYPTDMFDHVIAVNLRGVFLTLKHTVPLLLEGPSNGQGPAIVVTSSVAGRQGYANLVPYSATKHGIIGITRSAARDYGGKIRVNALCPGVVDTPMIDRLAGGSDDWVKQILSTYGIQRKARPDEIGEAAVWLCTKATFITGQTLVMDGGGLCA